MWGVKLVGLVVGLLVMVPHTMQLHFNHPLHGVIDRINQQVGKSFMLGLVLNSKTDETQLLNSEYFQPISPPIPPITIAGRKFNFGMLNNIITVYVLAGEPLAGVSATVQILLHNLRVGAIISIGGAGGLADDLRIGDVAVLHAAAYTGVWKWQATEREGLLEGTNITLAFGEYNLPEAGDNKLAVVDFQTVKRFTPQGNTKTTFWFSISPLFKKLTSKLQEVELARCIEETNCLSEKPKVVVGLKGGSSDIYISNKAYANFLKHKVHVSVVDTKSAAVASTAYANGVPFALLHGVTNIPGIIPKDRKLSALASQNSITVAASFAELIRNNIHNYYYYYSNYVTNADA